MQPLTMCSYAAKEERSSNFHKSSLSGGTEEGRTSPKLVPHARSRALPCVPGLCNTENDR